MFNYWNSCSYPHEQKMLAHVSEKLFPFSMFYRFRIGSSRRDDGKCCLQSDTFEQKIKRIFKKYKEICFKGAPKMLKSKPPLVLIGLKQILNQNRIIGCNCWGPSASLDKSTLISYASFFIKWYFMSYDAYNTKMWHKSIWPIICFINYENPLYFCSKELL